MTDNDREEQSRRESTSGEPDGNERATAPPIEREHETQAGVFEEDERRERKRQER